MKVTRKHVFNGTLRELSGEYVTFPGLAQSNPPTRMEKDVVEISIDFVMRRRVGKF